MNNNMELLVAFLLIVVVSLLVYCIISAGLEDENIQPVKDAYRSEEKEIWPCSLLETVGGGENPLRITGVYLSPELAKKFRETWLKVETKGKAQRTNFNQGNKKAAATTATK